MVRWFIEPGTRCDLVFYSAANMSGRRKAVRIFPGGNRQGPEVEPDDLRSIVVRAPIGTRVVLCRSGGPTWETFAWRCLRLLPGQVVSPQRAGGLPGVRVPDLDHLDPPGAKHTDREVISSYPVAESLEAGDGWTYGRLGELKGRVTAIRVERDAREPSQSANALERLIDDLVRRVGRRDPALARAIAGDAVAALAEGLGGASAAARAQRCVARALEEPEAS